MQCQKLKTYMETGRVIFLPARSIRPNPSQPRKIFREEALTELSDSIRQHGILQPLSVRRVTGGYELIAGERRLRAAQMAGVTDIPCIVMNMDERESAMTAILEKAEQLGVKVMLEAMSELDGDTYQTIAETGACVRSFNSPALQLQIDTMHIAYNKEDFVADIRAYGDLLGQVDISDPERMVPGGKLFDFPALIAVLKEVGFEGYLLSEFRAAPPEDAAKVGLDYIKSLL